MELTPSRSPRAACAFASNRRDHGLHLVREPGSVSAYPQPAAIAFARTEIHADPLVGERLVDRRPGLNFDAYERTTLRCGPSAAYGEALPRTGVQQRLHEAGRDSLARWIAAVNEPFALVASAASSPSSIAWAITVGVPERKRVPSSARTTGPFSNAKGAR